MFTGIITDKGRIAAVEARGDLRVTISTAYDMATVDLGASIACSGVCLTAIELGQGWFRVQASAETRGTACGQDVIGSGGIVAGGFGAISSDENAACVTHASEQ